MDTLYEYVTAAPAQRVAENARRGWHPAPPSAHTHRARPLSWALEGHRQTTRPDRAPTHRKDMDPVVPVKFRSLLDALRAPNA